MGERAHKWAWQRQVLDVLLGSGMRITLIRAELRASQGAGEPDRNTPTPPKFSVLPSDCLSVCSGVPQPLWPHSGWVPVCGPLMSLRL